jgi:3-dehydro-4-phosphotetronate decarboxylase
MIQEGHTAEIARKPSFKDATMREGVGVEQLVEACRLLAALGLGTSTSGNLSYRCGQAVCATPTGVSLGDVTAEGLSHADLAGRALTGPPPTKELGMHLAVYLAQSKVAAVIHVHPTHAVAVSTLLSPGDMLPSVTPQFVMRAGRVPVLPYAPPGSDLLGQWLAASQAQKAVCLQNHGVVTFGTDFRQALGTLEELEENCRLWLLAGGRGRVLSDDEVRELLGRRM